jgi:hypothetical protein
MSNCPNAVQKDFLGEKTVLVFVLVIPSCFQIPAWKIEEEPLAIIYFDWLNSFYEER